MHAEDFIDRLAAKGLRHFAGNDVVDALGVSPVAARAQLRRLQARGLIARPCRGFFVIVPPEYRGSGCLPPEDFIDQLMGFLGLPYYVCLLSAAGRYGAAHQQPQALQIMVPAGRPPIECGRVRITFIARSGLDRMPVSVFNTAQGTVRYSTPELTALELLGYPDHAGGIGNIATVLSELAEQMDRNRLAETAALCPISWAQRLGYLLDVLNHSTLSKPIADLIASRADSFTPLRRSINVVGAQRCAKWKLIVNTDVEPDV